MNLIDLGQIKGYLMSFIFVGLVGFRILRKSTITFYGFSFTVFLSFSYATEDIYFQVLMEP